MPAKTQEPTTDNPNSARIIARGIGAHATFDLWLIDAMPSRENCILEIRGDGHAIAGTVLELRALAKAILAFKGA